MGNSSLLAHSRLADKSRSALSGIRNGDQKSTGNDDERMQKEGLHRSRVFEMKFGINWM